MKKTLEERFDDKVIAIGSSGCWYWTASTSGTGYGYIGMGSRTLKAHRLSWELHHGPIPKGLCVLHDCDNPSCVNPAHLFLGTMADNNRDMIEKGRARHPVRHGEATSSAKLTYSEVIEIRGIGRSSSQREVAARYGVSRAQISNILRGKNWANRRGGSPAYMPP